MRRVFLIFTLLLPVFFFVVLEGGLRVFGYGPDLSLFVTETLNGRLYYIMNPAVKSRYFSRVIFTPTTSPDYFSVPKPRDTYRIFCLGGSTTVGFPYWYNGSLSSFLRDRLRRTFPDRTIEVINLGMTATNSYTVVDMARDVLDYEPDLLLVYDGHNEFYGALGVASRESMGGSRWLSRLSLRLVHLRSFLLLRDAYNGFGRLFAGTEGAEARGTLMEKLARGRTIPLESQAYRDGLDAFTANIAELHDLCSANGVPVILGTQASNLRSLSPFVSGEPAGATPQQRLAFHESFNDGLTQWMNGAFDSAFTAFSSAASLFPYHAESHYRRARCLDTLDRWAEARSAYLRARDLDELRFRTSSDFNAAIRNAADTSTLFSADIEQAFADSSPHGIIGNELILEHLHPAAWGNFLIAKTYAKAMSERGLLASRKEWAVRDTISDASLWAARPVTELDERIARRRTEALVTTWPFQPEELPLEPIAAEDTIGQIADQIARGRIHWRMAHDRALAYYALRNDTRSMECEYRAIINQLPYVDVQPYLKLAHMFLVQSRTGELRAVLEQSLQVEPTILAYRALADIALRSENPRQAAVYYEKTFSFPQAPAEQAENGTLLAVAFFRMNDLDRAETQARRVLSLKPDHRPAVDLLSEIAAARKLQNFPQP
jgi:tetratricopeptide (TPR) repeat protein